MFYHNHWMLITQMFLSYKKILNNNSVVECGYQNRPIFHASGIITKSVNLQTFLGGQSRSNRVVYSP